MCAEGWDRQESTVLFLFQYIKINLSTVTQLFLTKYKHTDEYKHTHFSTGTLLTFETNMNVSVLLLKPIIDSLIRSSAA